MNFHQLLEKIFTNYDQTHYDILCDVLMTSEQHANAILAKYDTSELTQDEFDRLKKLIVNREVGAYLVFVGRHKDVLNGDLSDKERTLLQKRIRRHIYDNEVTKILQNLVDDLKKKQ